MQFAAAIFAARIYRRLDGVISAGFLRFKLWHHAS
jgi:hypothetical protein